jgi:hypothetical protein
MLLLPLLAWQARHCQATCSCHWLGLGQQQHSSSSSSSFCQKALGLLELVGRHPQHLAQTRAWLHLQKPAHPSHLSRLCSGLDPLPQTLMRRRYWIS